MTKKLFIPALIVITLLLTISPIIASCASPGSQNTTGQTSTGTAKPEGTLVIREASALEEGFLPWIGGSATMIWEMVYEYLVYTKADGSYVPGLATKWEESKDALTVTAWLRKGVQWQGGYGEFTAEDVKYTYERVIGQGSTNSMAQQCRNTIKSIEIPDPYTIIWHLKSPEPLFWMMLTDVGNPFMPIVCKSYVEKVTDKEAMKNPIGTGPYKLIEHVYGDYLKYEAVESHWRIVPEFKYIITKIVPEQSTALAMLKTGAIDVTSVSPDQIPEVQAAGLKISTSPGGYSFTLIFGGMISQKDKRYKEGTALIDPWKDVRVREAMNIAIDRDAIIKTIYPLIGQPAVLPLPTPGYNKLKPIPYDPTRAKSLLASAGYPNGFEFKIISFAQSPATEMPKVDQAIAGYWQNIGLKPSIVQSDWATWKPKVQAGTSAGFIWNTRTVAKVDYTDALSNGVTYNSPLSWFISPETQAFFDRLVPESDMVKRNQIWDELNNYLRDNYTTLPIAYCNLVWATSNKVEKMPPIASGMPCNYVYARHATPLKTFRLFDLN